MRLLFLFGLVLMHFGVSSQVIAEPRQVDFGVITKGADRIVDITFTNLGTKTAYMLRSEFEPDFAILFSNRTIEPDSSITLRIKYNPRKTGTLRKRVPIYFSTMQDPIELRLHAEVEYVDPADNTACPDFRSRPKDCCSDWLLTINVRNALNGKPIPGAQVRIVEQGMVQAKAKTNSEGQIEGEVPIGYYLFLANAEEFLPADTALYINRRNNLLNIYLEPQSDAEPPALIEEEVTIAENELPHPTEVTPIQTGVLSINNDEEVPLLAPEGASQELPENLYAKNNVVFLIDVSQSMAQKGKLELLKASMLRLIEALREVDQVAIVTYASQTNVVLDVTHATNKTQMAEVIGELQAGGMTAGAKGFKGAFALNLRHYLQDGNNQVIVATDGAFRKADHAKIMKMVKKYERKKVTTTVIGIRSTSYTSKVLEEIAQAGGGSYLALDDFDAGQELLLQEIKKQSFIGR